MKKLLLSTLFLLSACDRQITDADIAKGVTQNLLNIESALCEADKACRGGDDACTLPVGSPYKACAEENEAFMQCILDNGTCLTDAAGRYFDLAQESDACDRVEDAMFACENNL